MGNEGSDGAPATARVRDPGGRAMSRWLGRHPLLVVAGVAALVAIGHGIWIWTHRQLGSLDADEAGYIASAFRYERLSLHDPLALPRAIGGTGNGPLVPLLSVPLLWFGPHDVRTVLLMQPILMVATAVSGAGIARRLAGPAAAVVTGIVLVTLPTVIFASQTYWLGLAAACSLATAIWALLASDRLTNRWTYGFGLGLAAMVLSRTMAVGFLPGALLAGAVVAGRRPASWRGLAKALATIVVVAGPWYLVARQAIFDYLFSYGFGERAGQYGQGGLAARVATRLERFDVGAGIATEVVLVVLVAAVIWAALRWDGWPPTTRGVAAVTVAVLVGFAALCSTTNNGVWFELPLVALLVPLLVSLSARVPLAVRAAAVVTVVLASVLQLGVSWWLVAPGPRPVLLVDPGNRSSQYEFGFSDYDGRFHPSRRDELAAASAQWRDLSTRVERRLDRLTADGMKVFAVSGSFQLFNSNTVQLAGELRGWTPRIRVPDTVRPAEQRRADLTPLAPAFRGGPEVERILVIALHRQLLFPADQRVRSFHDQAIRAGWVVTETIPIPLGGEVRILRLPEPG